MSFPSGFLPVVAAVLSSMVAPAYASTDSDTATVEKPMTSSHTAALVVVLGCTLLVVAACAYHFHHGSSKHLACVWSVELEDGKWYSYDHSTAKAIEFEEMFNFSGNMISITPTNPPVETAYHDVKEGTIKLDLAKMVEHSVTHNKGERFRKIRRDGANLMGSDAEDEHDMAAHIYHASDGFTGTYDQVKAHEDAHGLHWNAHGGHDPPPHELHLMGSDADPREKSTGGNDVEQQAAEGKEAEGKAAEGNAAAGKAPTGKTTTPEDEQLNTMLKVLVAVALIVITIVLYTSFA